MSASYFQGKYVDDIRDTVLAGILSGTHVVLIGPPGCGKTAIMRDISKRIVTTPEEFVFIRLDASTPPEVVSGLPDPAQALAVPPRIVYNRDGTFYDPRAKIIGADEFGRPSDVIFDKMLDVMNRQDVDPDDAPVVIGTSNFMPNSERTEAVRDRFGIWVHINPGSLDIDAVTRAHLGAMGNGNTGKLMTPGVIPTWNDVIAARKAVPGPDATKAISRLITDLCTEAAQAGIEVNNNRRIESWSRVLFRTGFYYSGGDDNFKEVPAKSSILLRYCMPVTDKKDWEKWGEVCQSIADVVGAAIGSVIATAYDKFIHIREESGGDMLTLTSRLGVAIKESQDSLMKLGKDDERITEALIDLQRAFADVVRGKDPMAR